MNDVREILVDLCCKKFNLTAEQLTEIIKQNPPENLPEEKPKTAA